ncbi:MAG: hypothetical protein AAF958_05650 [Planctomycetota bacterium]
MPVSPNIVRRWVIGIGLGTLIIGITSPPFVRSFLPNEVNRGVPTLPAGYDYRWRQEGYATTHVGPFGMPGRTGPVTDIPAGTFRIAIWGDSQAEGVAVADEQKWFAEIERVSIQRARDVPVAAFPLARSGDAIGDWLAQIPWAEKELGVDAHVFLIVDLPDLADGSPPDPPTQGKLKGFSAQVPAFVTQGAQHLIRNPDGTRRTLRFRPGPLDAETTSKTAASTNAVKQAGQTSDQVALILTQLRRLDQIATVPVWIVYAPPRPTIVSGKLIWDDPSADAFAAVRESSPESIQWIDATELLADSARRGQYPHGFHNGRIGVGHLNPIGYRILAKALVDAGSLLPMRRRFQ